MKLLSPLSITISVDVFERKLEQRSGGGSRGPPGVGYKLTTDGQYDANKTNVQRGSA